MPHFARRTANVATVVADMIYVGVKKVLNTDIYCT